MKIALSVSSQEKGRGTNSPYYKAMIAAGAQPNELQLLTAADAPLQLDHFDGVLFGGGADVDPELYGERKKYQNVRIDSARDKFELNLLDRALARRLPILGICRGIQLLNVKFNGTLYQDLDSEADLEIEHRQPGGRSEVTHTVTVTDRDSNLAESFTGSCRVNSLHHQAIKRLGRGLKVIARSEDGLVEAVELADDYPYLEAVQWHPEEMAEHREQLSLFQKFLAKCRERASQREQR